MSSQRGVGPALVAWALDAPLEDVRLVHDPRGDRTLRGDERRRARARWDEVNSSRTSSGLPKLTARRLYRPLDAARVAEGVVIHCGVTSYFDAWGAREPLGDRGVEAWTGAGLSVVPVCKDGAILLGRRSALVDRGVGLHHVAGGHAHPPLSFAATPQTLVRWALQELNEEMAVARSRISVLRFLGLVVNRADSKPEFVVEARLEDDSEACIRRWRERAGRAPEREEFTELARFEDVLGASPRGVLRSRTESTLVTAAVGAIELWTRS